MRESLIYEFVVSGNTVIDLLADGRQVFNTLPVIARAGERVRLIIERHDQADTPVIRTLYD